MNKTEKLMLIVVLGLLGGGCRLDSQKSQGDPNHLFPILKNGKWGYINDGGRVVIEPQFERTTPFTEGLAPVKQNGRWGYLDLSGNMVIKPQYVAALHFSEGIALVSYDDYWKKGTSQMFYVSVSHNRGGNTTDFPSLDDDGFDARPRDGGLRFAYIDKQGHAIFEKSLDYAFSFHEGLASVSIDRKAVYINTSGTIVLQTSFASAGSFSEGFAPVSQQKSDRWGEAYALWGYIDKSGNLAIEPQFSFASPFSEGLAAVVPDREDGDPHRHHGCETF